MYFVGNSTVRCNSEGYFFLRRNFLWYSFHWNAPGGGAQADKLAFEIMHNPQAQASVGKLGTYGGGSREVPGEQCAGAAHLSHTAMV